MTDKYELTDNTKEIDGHTLHQIKALKDLRNVKKGDLGGWIENLDNLSQFDTAWVYDNAKVYGNALVCGDAWVCDNAQVYDDAEVYGDVTIYGNAKIYGNAMICDNARVFDNAQVFEDARVGGNTRVRDTAKVYGDIEIHGNIYIRENDEISDNKSYLVFKNTWSSGRDFIYVLSNQRWHVGCFTGTGEELIKKAYQDSELSGKMYELYVHFAEQVVKTQR